ncbi:hypothetical protein Nocox_39020 [Nonomuraea coxensis DSM 45129]|uniref:HEAT repeat domain-containing protein n=1 Tax=Nonomuraea coxensis DSM 45129 TaxID=1122611 RepID=A0ABX8UF69_9ACTN|nr:hypothetical protein [Nonomuraea coxensis]QYC45354.1 hypothetical protein Nocox_39020 [Nonomuraea coxensis DSM 45129]
MTDTPQSGELDLDGHALTRGRPAPGGRPPATIRPVPRELARREADALLRSYLEPPCFPEAVRRLSARHLLVLVGEGEIGKRLGGLALLSRMSLAESTITVLSPAGTVAELLGGTEYAPGRAYLLHDWIAASTDPAELAGLARKLAELGSYLVITRDGAPSRAVEAEQPWAAPDPRELFDLCVSTYRLRAGVAPDTLVKARHRAAELPTPAQVVRLAAGLAPDGEQAGAVRAAEEVAAWFDTKPAMREVLAAAALAFTAPLPEAVFEARLARLDPIWQAHENGPPTPSGPHPLISRAGGQAGFPTPEHRGQVLAELAARYGFWLWQPLRAWVRSLAAEEPEVRGRAAEGVAALAAYALKEARAEFLEVWAAGTAGERLAAAEALSSMCARDTLAPEALRLALDWAADPARAVTAAVALGGDLALRYPADCERALRRLSAGDGPAAAVARRMMPDA